MNSDLLLLGRRTIEKEAKALQSFVLTLEESFVKSCEAIYACQGTVILTGMGKSGLVARKWASTLASTGTKAYFVDPAEAPHGDLGILRPNDILIALSYSGETKELGYVIRHARDLGIITIGITGNPESSLARQSTMVLSVHLSEEACPLNLAPTTSTTVMMALGDALSVTLMQMRGFTSEDFARLHPGGNLGRKLWLRVEELMHKGDAIPVVKPNDNFETVLIVMTRKCLGLAVVIDNGTICGVITDGDLRRYFQEGTRRRAADPRGGDPRSGEEAFEGKPHTTAADLMTINPKTIASNALAVEARELMERNSIHQLLIVDAHQALVGVLHLHDLLRAKVL